MMAGLFLIMTASVASVFFGKRGLSITLLLIGIILSCALFWHHVTDDVNINL